MTSPAAPHAARRRMGVPAMHRLSRNVLVIGSALALAATLGPAWVVRIGVAVAVVAALVACVAAWRELSEARRSQSLETLAASHEHGLALSQERRDNAAVLQALADRARQAVTQAGDMQVSIVTLTRKLSTAAAQNAFLQSELRHRERVIVGLRDLVRTRDAELDVLKADAIKAEALKAEALKAEALKAETLTSRETSQQAEQRGEQFAQVRAIPRRALLDPQPGVDMSGYPRRPELDLSPANPMVLPNYEEDRRLA